MYLNGGSKYGIIKSRGDSVDQYSHPDLIEILTIPFTRPVKSVYVKEVLDAIRKLEGSEHE